MLKARLATCGFSSRQRKNGVPLREEFTKGIIRQNPVISLTPLGLCPTLAVTTSLKNGIAMGVATTAVLVSSNLIISIFKRLIPKEIRIPCYIVVIASFVTIVELTMQATLPPALNQQLGIFIPLIVVNCIILGRAEAFASKNTVAASFLDGLGTGLGFVLALALVSGIRELLGNGTLWGLAISGRYEPAATMIMAPGAFLVLGLLLGAYNLVRGRGAASAAHAERIRPASRKPKGGEGVR